MGQLIFPLKGFQRFRMTREPDTTKIHADRRTYHILLAEDCSADVGIVRIALRGQNLDHVLHVAKDGEEAIGYILEADRHLNAPCFDLVLLDMHLPKHDGEEILKCLRSTECYAQTPVVIMSASDAPGDHEKAQEHGALIYFRKPSALAEFAVLGKIVRDILTGSEPATPDAPAQKTRSHERS